MSPWQRWRWWRLQRRRQQAAGTMPESSLRTNYLQPLPAARLPLAETPLLAVDLEMTGLNASEGEIVSIGWVPLNPGRYGLSIDLKNTGHVLVLSEAGGGVGHSATVHGIRDCDRLPGLGLEQALEALYSALENRIPVFHHAPLDRAFLDRACRRIWNTPWLSPVIDTLAWHRRRQINQHDDKAANVTRLDALRAWYRLEPRDAHHALDDALSCAELLLILNAKGRPRLGDVAR